MQILHAFAPLSEMLGYAADLRARTQGRATSSMHLDRYDTLPDQSIVWPPQML